MIINNNNISRFFVEKEFRFFRHLVLLLLISILTLSFIWYVPVTNVHGYYKIYAWFAYFVIFTGIIYHNLYIAVPRIFLKNRILQYTYTLITYIFIAILTIISIQYCLLKIDFTNFPDIKRIIINISSIIFILCFIFMGSTSILLVKHRILSDIEKSELESSLLESELKMLRNQINPHFFIQHA